MAFGAPPEFPKLCLTKQGFALYGPGLVKILTARAKAMKKTNSLKSLKTRDRDCRIVRRRGRLYIINKKNPRYKARQG